MNTTHVHATCIDSAAFKKPTPLFDFNRRLLGLRGKNTILCVHIDRLKFVLRFTLNLCFNFAVGTMGVVVFVLLTCVTLTTLAVGDASQLEKTV